jgi:hypothetical protein
MIQTYIILPDIHPVEAVRTGADKSICGKCAHRGHLGTCRACYVNLLSVGEVYKSYKKGNYPKIERDEIADLFKYAKYPPRLGSYGDPVMVPLWVWEEVTKYRSNWTGYTAQWRLKRAQRYKSYLEASTNSYEDYHLAKEMGWDSFRVGRKDEPKLKTEIYCPATPEGGAITQCADCTLCMGTSRTSKDILTRPHGKGSRYHEERDHRRSNPQFIHKSIPEPGCYCVRCETARKLAGRRMGIPLGGLKPGMFLPDDKSKRWLRRTSKVWKMNPHPSEEEDIATINSILGDLTPCDKNDWGLSARRRFNPSEEEDMATINSILGDLTPCDKNDWGLSARRRFNPSAWKKIKDWTKSAVRLSGKLSPIPTVSPTILKYFGSYALDRVIPRKARYQFLRDLDAHLKMGRGECLNILGPEQCQKIENTAIALGKKWADTSRSVEEWTGRDGQFDAYVDLFNRELADALEEEQVAKPYRRNADRDLRTLQRKAAQGDYEAFLKYRARLARSGHVDHLRLKKGMFVVTMSGGLDYIKSSGPRTTVTVGCHNKWEEDRWIAHLRGENKTKGYRQATDNFLEYHILIPPEVAGQAEEMRVQHYLKWATDPEADRPGTKYWVTGWPGYQEELYLKVINFLEQLGYYQPRWPNAECSQDCGRDMGILTPARRLHTMCFYCWEKAFNLGDEWLQERLEENDGYRPQT